MTLNNSGRAFQFVEDEAVQIFYGFAADDKDKFVVFLTIDDKRKHPCRHENSNERVERKEHRGLTLFGSADAKAKHYETEEYYDGVDKQNAVAKLNLTIFLQYHCHDVRTARRCLATHYDTTPYPNHHRTNDAGEHKVV